MSAGKHQSTMINISGGQKIQKPSFCVLGIEAFIFGLIDPLYLKSRAKYQFLLFAIAHD